MTSIGKLFSIYVDNYANKLLDFRIVTAVVFLVFYAFGSFFMAQVLIIGAMINATVQKYAGRRVSCQRWGYCFYLE